MRLVFIIFSQAEPFILTTPAAWENGAGYALWKVAAMATMKVLAEIEDRRFEGFPEGAFEFFAKLKRNNRREWFAQRKALYEETLLAPMLLLVRDLAVALHAKGLPVEPPRRAPVHRIYRDIRFSNDKTPFQTHISSALYRGGDKKTEGMVYLQLDAKQPFAAAGFWLPEKASLRRWRDSLAEDPDTLLRFAKKMPLDPHDTLQRMPRGYEQYAETEAAPLLKLKSFLVRSDLPQAELGSRAILKRLVRFAQQAEPLLRYGWNLEPPSTAPREIA